LLRLQARVVAGRRAVVPKATGSARSTPQHVAKHLQKRASVRQYAALAEPPAADASFASLMDDEDYDEFEDEFLDEEEEVAVDPSLLVDNLGLSEETVRALKARGIASLFPIQRQVLQPAMEGSDLIGRAKTGSGKTLAFALPVVESLLPEDKARGSRKAPGRTPRCLILAPTRELAKQVASEFESVCPQLTVVSFYGGTSIVAQIEALRRGVDVVVGTPGRVMDLLDRKKLNGEKVPMWCWTRPTRCLTWALRRTWRSSCSRCRLSARRCCSVPRCLTG
jgi:hypothetical protein